MARQITYANDSSVSALDRLTGIDSVDRSTKNFTIEAIAQLFASTGLADVSKLAFFYDYNSSKLASKGQAYYEFTGGIEQPAFINQIIFNRYDSTGKDFEPLAGSIRGSHIKLTAVGNAADTNYGLYEVLTNPTISGNTITVSVRHLASSGTLPNDEISISVLSSTATGTGVSVTDGEDPPVANATNHEGDLYIQIQEHETEVGQHQVNIWLYKNGVWVDSANLTGRQGEMGIQGFTGVGIKAGTASGDNSTVGLPTTFTVELEKDPLNTEAPDPGVLTFTVPAGAKGNPGDNIDPALLDFENDSSDVNQINVTYNSIPIGSFDVQEGIDGRSIVGIVRTTGDGSPGTTDTYTITYDKGTPLTQTFDVYNGTNGKDGTNVTLETITNGVRVTGEDVDGDPVVVDITNGTNGSDGTDVTLLAITDGVRVTGEDTAGNPVSVDIEDGSNVFVTPIVNGVNVSGEDIAGDPVSVNILNGSDGIGLNGDSVTAIDQVTALNSNVITTTVTPGDPIFLRFTVTGPTYFWFEIPAGAMGTTTKPNWLADESDAAGILNKPTNLIDNQNLATAKSTLGIPSTFAPTSAEANVQANWNTTDNTLDSYIENKPVNATQSVDGFMSSEDKTKLDTSNVNDTARTVTIGGVSIGIPGTSGGSGITLAGHDVTELDDVSNAGSGIIISDAERTKLDGIASGAEVNVQADWNENTTTSDAYIENKPGEATTTTRGFFICNR